MDQLFSRMLRAMQLDTHLYEEVESDESATGQAAIVVVLASVAAGFGAMGQGLLGLVVGLIGALLGWVVWAFIIYIVGTIILPEPQTRADLGQVLRTLGFASSPGIFRILGFVPFLGGIVLFVVSIWLLVSMVVAVRQALDYESTLRAVGVCFLGWIGYILINIPLAILGLIANSVAG